MLFDLGLLVVDKLSISMLYFYCAFCSAWIIARWGVSLNDSCPLIADLSWQTSPWQGNVQSSAHIIFKQNSGIENALLSFCFWVFRSKCWWLCFPPNAKMLMIVVPDLSYCWWFRNPAVPPVEVGSFSPVFTHFYTSQTGFCRISEASTSMSPIFLRSNKTHHQVVHWTRRVHAGFETQLSQVLCHDYQS